MTTFIAFELPLLNNGSPVTFLSDVTNNFNYSCPKSGYGECYCLLSLSHKLSSLREYSDASLPGAC